MSYRLIFTKQAQKDAILSKRAGLRSKTESILGILRKNPYQNLPPYEKLIGDLKGAYLRRINVQHRVVYQIYEKEKIVKIIRMWTHYQ